MRLANATLSPLSSFPLASSGSPASSRARSAPPRSSIARSLSGQRILRESVSACPRGKGEASERFEGQGANLGGRSRQQRRALEARELRAPDRPRRPRPLPLRQREQPLTRARDRLPQLRQLKILSEITDNC